MRKVFLTNLLFVVAINLVVKPLYLFGVEVRVQNTLGAEVYGLYFALLNSAYLLQIINDFGIQIFNNRQVAIDQSKLRAFFPGFITLKVVLSGVYLLSLMILGIFLGFAPYLQALLLIGVNLILTSFILFLRSGISGLGYYRIDSALSVLDKFLMLIIVGGMLFLFSERFTLFHFVFGQMAALMLTLVFSWLLLNRYSPWTLTWLSFKQLRSLAMKALPYATAVFLMTIYTRLDGVMIMRLLKDGDYETGIYAAGYRILDAVNMIALLFALLLLPMFSNSRSSITQLRLLLGEGFRYMWMLVIPVCVFGISFREEIMTGLYAQADSYWGDVFGLLIANFILMGMMYVFGTFLTAMGHVKSMNIVFAITVLLNIVLNFLFIPHYKAAGAAAATLITQFFAVCGILALCVRVLPLNLTTGFVFRVLGFTSFCVGACLFILNSIGLVWYLALCVYIPSILVGAFVFRILVWSEIADVLRRV